MWHVETQEALWVDYSTPELLESTVREAFAQEVIAIDTETTGLIVWKDLVLYWSMAWRRDDGSIHRVVLPRSALSAFREVFEDPLRTWVLANAKFDMHMLANVGIQLCGKIVDICVMHALLYADLPHGLKDMHKQLFRWTWLDVTEVTDSAKFPSIGDALIHLHKTDLAKLVTYAGNDVLGSLNLYYLLADQLKASPTWSCYPDKIPTLWEYFDLTETPYTRTLYRMERAGMLVDLEYLATRRKPIQERLYELERAITRLHGRPININSGDQLRAWFIDKLGLTTKKFTKGGTSGNRKPSIDDEFIADHAYLEPVRLVKEHKDLTKLLSTYIDGLDKLVDHNNRVHCRFNQDVARTGRLSSAGPNLQNFPRPDNDKFKVRRAFIARTGCRLLARDYSQLEMVLLANAANDPKLLNIFREDKDIHLSNAALVLHDIYKEEYNIDVTYESVKLAKEISEQVKHGKLDKSALTDTIEKLLFARQAVKSIAYGTNYGMKPTKLAGELGIPIPEALKLYNAYMDTYPAVNTFFQEKAEIAETTGFAFTLLGRRRYLPHIHSKSSFERFQAQRQAGNTSIQGSAADLVKMAMLRITASNVEDNYDVLMTCQVHDELILDVPNEVLDEVNAIVTECMDHPLETDLPVPPHTDGGYGDNWAEAK